VALHLLGIEVGNLSRRRDGHAVAPSMTGWDALVPGSMFNTARLHAARRPSPPLLLHVTRRQMCAFCRTLDPNVLGGAVASLVSGENGSRDARRRNRGQSVRKVPVKPLFM
jgi:hypothetical protein